jgi:hypothetical protein
MIKLCDVYVNHRSELCATLSDGVRAVECKDVLYVDYVDQAAMQSDFDLWCAEAEAGEIGYRFVPVPAL